MLQITIIVYYQKEGVSVLVCHETSKQQLLLFCNGHNRCNIGVHISSAAMLRPFVAIYIEAQLCFRCDDICNRQQLFVYAQTDVAPD